MEVEIDLYKSVEENAGLYYEKAYLLPTVLERQKG